MATFDRPTVNDFLAQLQVQSDRALRQFQDQKNDIDSEFMKAGATGGSRHAIVIMDAVEEHLEQGVSILLGELRRALGYPELDAEDLRNLIGPRLQEFAARIVSSSGIPRLQDNLRNAKFSGHISERMNEIPNLIGFWLRQFDIGWDTPVEPEILRSPHPSR
jgi:hypothetical protein